MDGEKVFANLMKEGQGFPPVQVSEMVRFIPLGRLSSAASELSVLVPIFQCIRMPGGTTRAQLAARMADLRGDNDGVVPRPLYSRRMSNRRPSTVFD